MSSLARRAATLVGGNMIARFITLGLAPIVTRIFAPEAFGEFSAVLAVAMILGASCHLRYPNALLIPTDDDDLDGLTLLGLLLPFGFTFLAAAFLTVGDSWLADQLELAASPDLVWAIPPVALLTAWTFSLMQIGTRESRFKGLAASRVAQALGNRGVGIGLGLTGMISGMGLMLGRVAALAGALLTMTIFLGPGRLARTFTPRAWSRIRPMASRFRSFPLYSPTALLHQGTTQLPVVLLASLFDPAVAGLYALSLRILREPLNLFGEALAQVFANRCSELHRDGVPLSDFSSRYLDTVLKTALVPLALLGVVSPDVFGLVFGSRWQETGTFVSLLSPHYALILVAWPLSVLFDIMERLRARLVFDLAYFFATLGSLAAGSLLGGPLTGIALFSASSAALTLVRIIWLARLGGLETAAILTMLASRTALALAVIAPTMVCKFSGLHFAITLAAAATSACLYYAWLFKADQEFAASLRRALRRES